MVGTKADVFHGGEKCSRLQNGGCRIPCKMRARPKVPSIHPKVPSIHPMVPSIHPTLPSLRGQGQQRCCALPITRCPTGTCHLVLRSVGKVRSCLWGRGLWQTPMSHWKCWARGWGGCYGTNLFASLWESWRSGSQSLPHQQWRRYFFQTQRLLRALIFPDAAAVFKQRGTLT